jgi:hypothetical protein
VQRRGRQVAELDRRCCGSGDIGPVSGGSASDALVGLPAALIIVIVVAARDGSRTARRAPSRRVIAARAAVVGVATFITGLVAVGVVVPAGLAILRGNGFLVPPLPVLPGARVVGGLAVVLALCTVLAFELGLWLRRGARLAPEHRLGEALARPPERLGVRHRHADRMTDGCAEA